MDQTREDRMRSRMRGAARHQVQDADFGDLFTFPAAPAPEPEREPSDPPVATSPEPVTAPLALKRTSPNTSAKRRRLNSEGTAAPGLAQPQAPPPARLSSPANPSPTRAGKASAHSDPYDLENAPATADEAEAAPPSSTPRSRTTKQRAAEAAAAAKARETAPRPTAQESAPSQPSPLPALPVDEVGESPTEAPGSGHRRRVRASGAVDSSALLQSALRSVDNDTAQGFLQSSSPLSRMSRKSAAGTLPSASSTRTGLRRSIRLSGSPDDEVNELSSDMPVVAHDVGDPDISMEGPAVTNSAPEVADTVIDEPMAEAEAEPEGAEEIDDREAARRLGKKRPPRRMTATSPELSPDEASEEPVAMRPRKAAPSTRSPATQRQPKAPRAKQKEPAPARKRKIDEASGPPVPVTIQRFTRVRRRGNDESDDEDILNLDIPHANRVGVNAVDVLAQICEDIITKRVDQFKEESRNAQGTAAKRQLRVKLWALEAFQAHLRTRLLEHTIAIDTLFSLKKRVREAQREKLKLRERIIEIRAEREQVALRMDAIRTKHDEDSKEALHNINLSAAMHDVDLAIEQGRAAPELSAKDQKTAELANLELLISRATEQACSSGPGGGALKQIKSFNAFLERAAAAL